MAERTFYDDTVEQTPQQLPEISVTAAPTRLVPAVIDTTRRELVPVAVPYAPAPTLAGIPWWLMALGALGLYLIVTGRSRGSRSF